MQLINPATGEPAGEVPEDDEGSVALAVDRARVAQPGWAATPLATRLAAIARFRDLIAERRDRLALALTRDMGKPITQSKNELSAMAGRLDFFLGETEKVLAETVVLDQPDGALRELIRKEPLGVIANISAWNYPWFVGSNVFVPALLAGNAVLYKPSENATRTGGAIEALLHEAGVPPDVFIAVIGGREVGGALVEEALDGVFFTGSYATGRRIAERLAPRLVRFGLELGGKDPTYVADDADVASAAESLADGAMYNTGQSCCSVERLYVHQAVEAPFLEAFVAAVRGMKLGDPEDAETYIGPLAREAQLDVLDAQVADAVAKGGRVLSGGKRAARPGFYYEPTVIAGATHAMLLMREESFGPVIGVQTVQSDDGAVSLMNDTDYGLTAGVYTRDVARAERLLARVNAGTVYVNACDRVSPRLPWTGRKHSGIGSTLSTYGIDAFVQLKAWHEK